MSKQEETFLNGEKVTDETRRDGDKIKIATTKKFSLNLTIWWSI